jgi:hypothetical protein
MSGFQSSVNLYPAPAVAGDFASENPRASVPGPESGFVAGANGVTIGKMAWIAADGKTVNSYGTAPNAPDGFVHREQQGLIETYLQETSVLIPAGFPVTLMRTGDYFANVTGATGATKGSAVYATYATGDITIGSAATGASVTAVSGSTNTAIFGATFTASAHSGDNTRIDVTAVTGYINIGDTLAVVTGIAGNQTVVSQDSGGTTGGAGTYVLSGTNTASSVACTCFGSTVKITSTTGLISIGDTISGGAGFPTGATIATQVSGTAGGAGVYTLSAAGTAYVASASGVTTFGNVLDVTAVGSGTLAVGDPVSGGSLASTACIASQISGTAGGIGIYTLSVPCTAYSASTTITAVAGVATNWVAGQAAAVGELTVITQ